MVADEFEMDALLEFLKRNRGFDFSGYKRSSLVRRIHKRMQTVNVESYIDYMDYLQVRPEEFVQLFDTILINITDFYRDPEAWQYLAENVLPVILKEKRAGEAVRVWCAGSASGEEAYTILMLLADLMGEQVVRERVKVYATDLDDEALNKARQATYTAKEVSSVPKESLERYFEPVGADYAFHRDLRRLVIFGRHDLIQDAPISRIDLLICRNILMYFNAETQTQVINRLHFAVGNNGYLFLGKAEMLLAHSHLFSAVHLKHRIFKKIAPATLRERMMIFSKGSSEMPEQNNLSALIRLRDLVFDTNPVAQIVVNAAGNLMMCNQQARYTFDLGTRDLGRPFRDLELSYRPVELRSMIEQSYIERKPIQIKNILWRALNGVMQNLDIQVSPLIEDNQAVLGASISFSDVTQQKSLQVQLEHSYQELETAMEELQSTNEELETTNEELQSTIEELETTNEELQSTNEELETMNEELQSTNQELEAVNDELSLRNQAYDRVNVFLEAIQENLDRVVVVLDQDMHVQMWNRKASELWGLQQAEVVGRNFLGLNFGLPVETLGKPIRACLADGHRTQNLALEAHNRRGQEFQCEVSCAPLYGKDHSVQGVILMMAEKAGRPLQTSQDGSGPRNP